MNQIDKLYLISTYTSSITLIADVLFYPFELITTKIKTSRDNKNALYYLKTMYKKNKYKGLYRGVGASCYEAMCSNIPFLIVYEYSIKNLEKKYKDNIWALRISPFIASIAAEFICLVFQLPITTIKTRIQSGRDDLNYKSIIDGFRKVKKKEGLKVMYKSLLPMVGLYFIQASLLFGFYENGKKFITNKKQQKKISMIHSFILATICNTIAIGLTNPLDTFCRHVQIFKTKNKNNFWKEFRIYYKKQTHLTWLKGFGVYNLHHSSITVLYVCCYEFFRQYYDRSLDF